MTTESKNQKDNYKLFSDKIWKRIGNKLKRKRINDKVIAEAVREVRTAKKCL